MEKNLITRLTFDSQKMMQDYPPEIHNRNKWEVFRIACPKGCSHSGEVAFSRWRECALPEVIRKTEWQTNVQIREDVFGYEPTIQTGMLEWYLNFSNYEIFTDYGGPLLAQDELQVAEHPALASLRETLVRKGTSTRTVENDRPTPILVRNVERRCSIDTRPCSERPYGLYGNEFSRALPEDIIKATKQIVPPTITNIIAIEAPADGYGAYTVETIEYILCTAATGFAAARFESLQNGANAVTIHTGFWGCGAYGGNRILMTALQIIAANLAGINKLVFHAINTEGASMVQQAVNYVRNGTFYDKGDMPLKRIIDQIVTCGFEWGESDGN